MNIYRPKSRVVRYIISGGLSFLTENLSFLLFFYVLSIMVSAANVMSIIVALILNFFVSKHYVFDGSHAESKAAHQFLKYLVLVGLNMTVSTICVSSLVGHNVPGYVAKPAVTVMIAGWTYFAFRRIFKAPQM